MGIISSLKNHSTSNSRQNTINSTWNKNILFLKYSFLLFSKISILSLLFIKNYCSLFELSVHSKFFIPDYRTVEIRFHPFSIHTLCRYNILRHIRIRGASRMGWPDCRGRETMESDGRNRKHQIIICCKFDKTFFKNNNQWKIFVESE